MSRALPLFALTATLGISPLALAAPPTTAHSPAGHGHMAPVDCPLAKAGHDPAKMRPFEEVAEYIAFLERPDRLTWQKPDAVVEALKLPQDAVVVDLGAGSGYFAFRFASALPKGRVDALDVEPEMVRHMHHTAMTQGVDNLHADFADPQKPKVSKDASLVFVCDVLHHVGDTQAWLSHVAGQLPKGARLALIEFKAGKIPQGPPEGMKIPKAKLLAMAAKAGLALAEDHSALLPYQDFLVFRRK